MNYYVKSFRDYEDRWNDMSRRERFDAMKDALEGYLDSRIDGAEVKEYEMDIGQETIVLCSMPYMYGEMTTEANLEWWKKNAEAYFIFISPITDDAEIPISFMDSMSFDDAEAIVDRCNNLLDYPIIDEMIFSELEDKAFEEAFRETFMDGEGLKFEWAAFTEEEIREAAWDTGSIECTWFYISEDRVQEALKKNIPDWRERVKRAAREAV